VGQKVHPVGMRLGITRTWDSRWFEDKQYQTWLHEDLRMRKLIDGLSRSAGVSRLEIERRANQVRVVISTAKPGIIIGKRGAGIEDLKKRLEKASGRQVNVNVLEIKHPELDAKLVANNIVDQLEKRIAFRRAMRQAIQRTIKAGAKGIKVQCGGRLGGAEIARVERNFDGKVPLHTLRANIDYAHTEAYTTFGRIGVKVWIYLGEVLPEGRAKPESPAGRVARPAGTRRPVRPARPAEPKPETATVETPTPSEAPAAVAATAEGSTPPAAAALEQPASPETAAPPAEAQVPPAEAAPPPAEAQVPPAEAAPPPAEVAAPSAEAAAPPEAALPAAPELTALPKSNPPAEPAPEEQT
jgi:small subunit ribosomal protein S3